MNNEAGKPERLWIKIGDNIIQEIDRNILADDVFDIRTGNEMIQITNDDGNFKVTNAVNGWGNNCKADFENSEVTFLTPASQPSGLEGERRFTLAEALEELYEEVKHGDDQHKAWLKEKFNQFIKRH